MQPGQELVNAVRAGFVLKGTSMNKYCLSNAIDVSNAKKALLGSWDGPKALVLRNRLIEESSTEESSTPEEPIDEKLG